MMYSVNVHYINNLYQPQMANFEIMADTFEIAVSSAYRHFNNWYGYSCKSVTSLFVMAPEGNRVSLQATHH